MSVSTGEEQQAPYLTILKDRRARVTRTLAHAHRKGKLQELSALSGLVVGVPKLRQALREGVDILTPVELMALD